MNTTIYRDGKFSNFSLEAKQPSDLETTSLASFVVHLPDAYDKVSLMHPENYQKPSPNFYILHADEDVALFYFCMVKRGHYKDERAWIYSRDQSPDFYKIYEMEEKLQENGVSINMQDSGFKQCSELNKDPWEVHEIPTNKFVNLKKNKDSDYYPVLYHKCLQRARLGALSPEECDEAFFGYYDDSGSFLLETTNGRVSGRDMGVWVEEKSAI